MQIDLKAEYVIHVSQSELTLIGLALCGQLKDSSRDEATALNRKLLEQQRALHAFRMEQAEGALRKLDSTESKG